MSGFNFEDAQVALGLTDEEIVKQLPDLLADFAASAIRAEDGRLEKSIQRARTRLHFTGGDKAPSDQRPID